MDISMEKEDFQLWSYERRSGKKFSSQTPNAKPSPCFFYRIPLTQTKLQENLRIFLDLKLTFENHLKTISQKTNKTLGLLPKLKTSLRRPSVFAIYK